MFALSSDKLNWIKILTEINEKKLISIAAVTHLFEFYIVFTYICINRRKCRTLWMEILQWMIFSTPPRSKSGGGGGGGGGGGLKYFDCWILVAH